MADIVDAFVVSLGLDPTNYNDEMKKYRADRKKLASEDETYQRREQDGSRKTVEGLRKLRNETAGFLALLAGANSIGQFVGNLMTGDAATGRFAANIGMATERVSAWENAIKRVGGTSQEAQGNLRALASIFQNYTLGTDFSKRADLAYFGLTERDLESPENALMQLHEKGQNLNPKDRQIYTNRLNRLGLSDSMVTLLSKPTSEFKAMMADIEKLGTATDETAQAAMTLEEEMAKTAQSLQGAVRPALSDITEAFKVLTAIVRDELVPAIRTTIDTFRGFFGLGKSDAGGGGLGDSIGSNLGNMLTGGDYKNAWDYYGDWVGGENGALIKKRMGAQGGKSAGGGSTLSAFNTLITGMGGRPINIPSGGRGGLSRSAASVEQYFQSKGFTAAQAKGIAAAVHAEGGLGTRTGGGYKGRTIGIGQLLGSRRAKFLKRYGNNFTFQNELDFMLEEMHNGDGGFVGNSIRQSSNSGDIAKMMVDRFYRPAKGGETFGDYRRAASYLRAPVGRGAGSAPAVTNVNTVGTIVIHTAGKDAETIARDMRAELQKRGLVVQASSGLKP